MIGAPARRTTCWLTTNRACNLKCPWCYAKNSPLSEDMSLDTARLCLQMSQACHVTRAVLLGGEPLVYSEIYQLIDLVHSFGMNVTLVTNGVLLGNESCAVAISEHMRSGDDINVSLKGETALDYAAIGATGISPSDIIGYVDRLNLHDVRISFSFVVTLSNVRSVEGLLTFYQASCSYPIGLSFCGPILGSEGMERNLDLDALSTIAEQVFCSLESVHENLDCSVHAAMPLCCLSDDARAKMNACSYRTGCQLLNQSGLIFDPLGNLLACNHLPQVPVGVMGEDYSSPNSFVAYLLSEKYSRIMNGLTALPRKRCSACEDLSICAGGCPLLALGG